MQVGKLTKEYVLDIIIVKIKCHVVLYRYIHCISL